MWLLIVGLVFTIILVIVLSPIKISVLVSERILIKINLLFFTLYSYDSSINKEVKKTEKKVKEKDNIKSTITKITNCSSNYEKLVILVRLLKSILSKFNKLLRHTVIKNFNFNIIVSSDDAADTAIKYGEVCSVVYPLSTLLSKCVNFKPESISVLSDFNREKTNFNLAFVVSVRIIYLLIFAISSVFGIIKLRMGVLSK